MEFLHMFLPLLLPPVGPIHQPPGEKASHGKSRPVHCAKSQRAFATSRDSSPDARCRLLVGSKHCCELKNSSSLPGDARRSRTPGGPENPRKKTAQTKRLTFNRVFFFFKHERDKISVEKSYVKLSVTANKDYEAESVLTLTQRTNPAFCTTCCISC